MITDDDFACNTQAGSIYFDYLSGTGVRIDLNGAGIRTDIGFSVVEHDVATVQHVDAGNVFGRMYVHHFHVVRTVDDGIQLTAVDGYVVAHVAQFLDNGGVSLGIDVAVVLPGSVVEEVDAGFVVAHVAFVQQKKAFDGASCIRRSNPFFFRVHHGDVAAAG